MRAVIVGLVGLAVAGCGETTLWPPTFTGSYDLSAVNRTELPAPDNSMPGCDIVFTGGILHIYRSGLFDLHVEQEVLEPNGRCPNGTSHSGASASGSYTLADDGEVTVQGERATNIDDGQWENDGTVTLYWRVSEGAGWDELTFRPQ